MNNELYTHEYPTITKTQKQVACPKCGGKHLVRWDYDERFTRCPKIKHVTKLIVKPETR